MDPRTAAALAAIASARTIDATPAEVEAELAWKSMTLERPLDDLDDDAHRSQVDQALDRADILAGRTAARSAPVDLAARATVKTRAVAASLLLRPGLRASGVADGLQVARMAVAMAEALHLAEARIPELRDDAKAQKASGTLFGAITDQLSLRRPDLPSMSDGEVLALCEECLRIKSARIAREAKA